ncbi:hypothetical protein GCM10010345_89550 [Streptomyces canarius]|uniref:Uncharacterized protein n=1 Tax=Streptomyces canarius TaxID=285453 RepID=A0ABQ3DAN3_9ACTN|nr:hypothetical protein GCM10010300_83210 [Streptomyces olivaceoviridis]GHA72775.1 hypothetical protein GCM10010345_89550 [Streptomyces canarius]
MPVFTWRLSPMAGSRPTGRNSESTSTNDIVAAAPTAGHPLRLFGSDVRDTDPPRGPAGVRRSLMTLLVRGLGLPGHVLLGG